MIRGKRTGLPAIGILILLAIGSAACSAGAPSAEAPVQVEVASRHIKVYESPT